MSTRRWRIDALEPVDVGPARLEAKPPDGTGFGHFTVYATRTGVFPYTDPDGRVVWELRHPQDVLAPEAMASLARVVAVRGHPRDAKGRPIDVTTENVKQLSVGHTGDAWTHERRFGYDHPKGRLTITDAGVLESVVTRGRFQVSMGYTVVHTDEAGTFEGIAYTRRQTQIRYNHIAIDIDEGRAGTAELTLDEGDSRLTIDAARAAHQGDDRRTTTVKVQVGKMELDFKDAGEAKIVSDAIDERDRKIADQAKEYEKLKAENDALKATKDPKADDGKGPPKGGDPDPKKDPKGDEKRDPPKTDAADIKAAFVRLDTAIAYLGPKPEEVAKLRDELLAVKPAEGETLVQAISREALKRKRPDEAKAIADATGLYCETRFDAEVDALRKRDTTGNLAAAVGGAGAPPKADETKPHTEEGRKVADAKIIADSTALNDPLSVFQGGGVTFNRSNPEKK